MTTNQHTREELLGRLKVAQEAYEKISETTHAACNIGAMDQNGPLYEAIWDSFENMLKLIDINGWFYWWLYENDCGRKGYQVISPDGTQREIRTQDDLIDVIMNEFE